MFIFFKLDIMYRITRVVPKNNIYDVLSLDYVSKVEIKQGKNNFRNPKICRVDIYLTFPFNDSGRSFIFCAMSSLALIFAARSNKRLCK